jgi:hypothetical protein
LLYLEALLVGFANGGIFPRQKPKQVPEKVTGKRTRDEGEGEEKEINVEHRAQQ